MVTEHLLNSKWFQNNYRKLSPIQRADFLVLKSTLVSFLKVSAQLPPVQLSSWYVGYPCSCSRKALIRTCTSTIAIVYLIRFFFRFCIHLIVTFFLFIEKFFKNKLILSFLAIVLVIKLIKIKIFWILPLIVGVTAAKKLLLKFILFLFPALSHLFKLCSYYHKNYHDTKYHHHHHQINHLHTVCIVFVFFVYRIMIE